MTINGNRLPSAEGDTRNVQLDLIPADMVQTIEVNKVVTSDMDGDAIGGSINLVTKSTPYQMYLSVRWTAYEGDDFYEDAERIFRTVLCRMKENGSFDKLTILKPYSFVLVDEDKETISELLLVDDDTLLVNDELLKGLDKELDDFLKDLLEK